MKTTTTSMHTLLTCLLFLGTFFLFPLSIKAQCSSCTTTINVTTTPNASININVDNTVLCLTAVNTTISPFQGTININANNVTVCISSNVRITSNANLNFSGTNGTINNFGTFQRINFTLSNGYTFNNIGQLEISSNLTINTGTFVNTGTANIDGSYSQTTPAQVNILGPTSIGGSATINGGNLTVTGIIVLITGDYNQNGGNVAGGSNPLLPSSGCGSLNVAGQANISNGIFGFGSGLIGMCRNDATPTGFSNPPPPGVVTPNGSIKCDCFQALPVELLYFRAAYNGKHVVLKWATVSEKDNSHFIVERSSNGVSFEEVTTLKGKGNSYSLHTYQSVDTKPYSGITYYRLKQTDWDGTFTYSDIVAVETGASASGIRIFPSPLGITESVEVQTAGASSASTLHVRIYDQLGKECFEARYSPTDMVKIPVRQFTQSAGIYVVQARRGTQFTYEKIIVQ